MRSLETVIEEELFRRGAAKKEQHVNEHKTDPTVMDRSGASHLNDTMIGRMRAPGILSNPGKERERGQLIKGQVIASRGVVAVVVVEAESAFDKAEKGRGWV